MSEVVKFIAKETLDQAFVSIGVEPGFVDYAKEHKEEGIKAARLAWEFMKTQRPKNSEEADTVLATALQVVGNGLKSMMTNHNNSVLERKIMIINEMRRRSLELESNKKKEAELRNLTNAGGREFSEQMVRTQHVTDYKPGSTFSELLRKKVESERRTQEEKRETDLKNLIGILFK